MRDGDPTVEVEFDLIEAVTAKAVLGVKDGEKIWLPKSQLIGADDLAKGQKNVPITMSQWIAGEKGLLD